MEDFDQLYEDELELMREMEDGEAGISLCDDNTLFFHMFVIKTF